MKYTAKLYNYPLTWDIEAASEEEAQEKAWEAIKKDMEQESIAQGGYLVINERKE